MNSNSMKKDSEKIDDEDHKIEEEISLREPLAICVQWLLNKLVDIQSHPVIYSLLFRVLIVLICNIYIDPFSR